MTSMNRQQVQKQRLIRAIVACKDDGFSVERRELAQRIYPRLRQYCMATHGIEFQILDFEGPSPGKNEDERSQYLEQLYLCHEQSLGPGLIAFIDGDDKEIASPRDSGFHQILDQAYFSYTPTKRNKKCLFVVRRSAEPGTMHDRKTKYRKEPLAPEPETLRDRVTELATKRNVVSFVLHTRRGEKLGIEQSHYLNSFCDSVYEQMVEMIEENVNEFTSSHSEASLKPEMTQHWNYAQGLSENFARENVQAAIKTYLESDSERMLVVHGPYALDLSSIVARVACGVRDWSSGHGAGHGHHATRTVVLRHLGLTPGSDLKVPLLRSICRQLKEQGEDALTSDEVEIQFHKIVHDGEYQGDLVLFLDSVQALSDLDWLPKRLAGNVKLVVSATSDSVAMATLKRKCYEAEQYVRVSMLSVSEQVESLDILHKTRYRQRLGKENLAKFADVLKPCERTGYYTSTLVRFAEHQRLPLLSAFSTIRTIDACLENQICCVSMSHPPRLLQKALGYLAIAPNGLSQLELEDVLSLDDEVMKETPGTSTNRIKSRMVCGLIKDLQALLIRLQIHGIEVYRFKDTIIEGYMYKEYVLNPGLAETLHSNMADYFLGAWSSRAKVFCDERFTKRLVRVPEQILVHNSKTKFPVYNKRKLTLLPYHLSKSDRTAELKSLVLYDFRWISVKIRALGIQELVQDYGLSDFPEAGIAATALKESEPFLLVDDSVLSIELAGRLLAYYNEYSEIKYLVDQCDQHSAQNGGLLPRLPLFVPPDTVLEKCGQIPEGPKYEHTLFRNGNVQAMSIRKATGHVIIYDLELNETVCDINVQDVHKTFLTPDGKSMIHFTKGRQVRMYSTETGELCMELPYQGDLVYRTAVTGQYVAFTMEKAAGPHLLDLSQGIFIHRLNLQAKIVALSRCGQYLVCDGSQRLNVYALPLVRRLLTLDVKDAKSVTFAPKQGPTPKGPDFYTVTKSGDLYHVTIDLVCNIPTIKKIIRDVEMREMSYAPTEQKYLVHCTRTIHVFDTQDRKLFSVKSLLPVDGNLTFEQALFTDDSESLVTIQGVHISVWDRDGNLIRMLVNPHQQEFTNAVIKNRHLFTLDSEFNSSKWDLSRVRNGTKPKANIHTGSVDRIVILNETTIACYGDDTPEVTLLSFGDGRKLRTLVPREEESCVIVHCCGSRNGDYLITVQANAEPIFPTAEVVCDAQVWRTETGECLLTCQGTEYVGFWPQIDSAFFIRFSPEIGRDCLVFDCHSSQQKTLPLPPMAILARPVIDSRSNLRFFTADLDGVDLLLWKVSLEIENDYKSVYFTETYMLNDIQTTENADVIQILHTGGLITYDLALHQIMRKISFPSSPNTIYNSQYTMALDGRRLHDLNHARNERLMRMRAAPLLVAFILKDRYLAYVSEDYDRLIVKSVKDGRRQAWCPIHGRGTSLTVAKDDRTILVGCEDGRILALTLVLDSKDSASLIAAIPSRSRGRPKTAKQVLEDDLDRVVLDSATRRVLSATTKPGSKTTARPGSSLPRPFSTLRCRPTSSPAIRLMDRPFTR